MSGIRERLLQIRGAVSPRRINEAIHPTLLDAEKVVSMLPAEVVSRTESRAGDIKTNKRNRFLKNIQNLIEKGYSLPQLLQMSGECVDNQGRINEDMLKRILNGEEDD
jgi:hypothetical protein